ncbi:MAG: hypothetical protein KJ065_14920 [Anaerolineae bacterium]|nr:hypothetical protein [Anaerolineae bacterium]
MRSYKLTMLLAALCLLLITPIAALAQADTALAYGSSLDGEITDAQPEVNYTFSGAAGDLIVARMMATGDGLDSYLMLLDPSGEQITFDDDDGGSLNSLIGPFSLPADGEYTLVATHCCPGGDYASSGSFVVSVDKVDVQPLADGELLAFELADSQQVRVYAYTATEPQVVWVQTQALSGPGGAVLNVLNLNQDILLYDSRSQDTETVIAPPAPVYFSAPGDYLVTLRQEPAAFDAEAAPVSGSLSASLLPMTALTLGETVSGTLDDANPFAVRSFDVSATQLLSLSGSSEAGTAPYELLVYDPNGIQILFNSTAFADNDSFSYDPFQLTASGTYVAVARRADVGEPLAGTSSTYTYAIGESQTTVLVPGEEVTGQLPIQNETFERVYRLDGVSGQRVRITIRSLDNQYAPGLYIQGPATGDEQAANSSIPGSSNNYSLNLNSTTPGTLTYETVLPATGAYVVRVSNTAAAYGSTAFPGQYGLLIEALDQ